MKIEITIPDEAIDRIANEFKLQYRQFAMKQGKSVKFEKDGAELIKIVLQSRIDELFLKTDPEFITAREQSKKISEDAKKATLEKLQALKNK